MSFFKIELFVFILLALLGIGCSEMSEKKEMSSAEEMLIRIAELEINSAYIEEYISILQEEAEASVRLELGVICIYPMFEKEAATQISLLEIYANQSAYEAHLQTPHFIKYKTETLKMVKSLRQVDMEAIDEESMPGIFKKFY